MTQVITTQYKKDLKLAAKQHVNLTELNQAISILTSGGKLPASMRDHQLGGALREWRELHAGPDARVLIYRIEGDRLILKQYGTHDHTGVGNSIVSTDPVVANAIIHSLTRGIAS